MALTVLLNSVVLCVNTVSHAPLVGALKLRVR